MRRLQGHEHESRLSTKRAAKDANAWAEKLRADAAKRVPAIPAPVKLAKEKL